MTRISYVCSKCEEELTDEDWNEELTIDLFGNCMPEMCRDCRRMYEKTD